MNVRTRPTAPSATPATADPPTDALTVRTVAAALASGTVLALLLGLVVFAGATESVISGSLLVGSGGGWAILALLLARRTGRWPLWAVVPALGMTTTGLALIVLVPADPEMSRAGWWWPPVALGLVGYVGVQVWRRTTGRGQWLVFALLLVLAAASAGALAADVSEAHVRDAYPAPGATYDVDGHSMHLRCQGAGSPTVVLVNGLGEISTSWGHITSRLRDTTRVCAYDRAGQAWSEDVTTPEDGVQAASDLHTLLSAAGERGPFVLAGHSIGGPYALVYASQYPDDVAGMVLLDSSSPEQMTRVPAYPLQYALMRRGLAVLPTLARIGLGSLFSTGSDLPGDDAARTVAMTGTARALRNGRDEISIVPTLFEQAQALTSLGDRPLAVLTASESLDGEGWRAAQDRLARLSTNSSSRTVTSSHQGMVGDALVAVESADAIAAVVSSVRSGAPLP